MKDNFENRRQDQGKALNDSKNRRAGGPSENERGRGRSPSENRSLRDNGPSENRSLRDGRPAENCGGGGNSTGSAREDGGSSAGKTLHYPPFVLKRIITLRKKRKLSQKQVAACLDMAQSTYSRCERGLIPLQVKDFIRLARLYNVSLDYITGATNIIRNYPGK